MSAYFLAVRSSEDIIHGNPIEISKSKKMFNRNGLIPSFIAGVYSLLYAEDFRYFRLIHIHILTQVSQPLKIHKNHSLSLYIMTVSE